MVASTQDNNIKGLLSGWGLSLTGRPCDNCHAASALLYCRADAAFLCGACDAHVHQHMATPAHERVWVCEVCEQAPAVVTCKADAAALCSTCDHDIHSANPLASRHERVPITPTSRSNAAAITASAFLVPDELDAVPNPPPPALVSVDDSDPWLIPNPNSSFLYNESDILNYGSSYDGCENTEKQSDEFEQHYKETKPKPNIDHDHHHHDHDHSTYEYQQLRFADSVVPTQSHTNNNNNYFSDTTTTTAALFENCFNIDFSQPNKHNTHKKSSSTHLFSPLSFTYSAQNSVSSSEIGVVPDNGSSSNNNNSIMSEISYSFARSNEGTGTAMHHMDREARVLRYREKRKNRKFQKTIRYASRKAYAETRPRIKGRFAKRTQTTADTLLLSDLDFVAVDNTGYGVVPAF